MKANVFLSFIAVLMAMLIGYFAYYISQGKPNDILCGICSTVCFVATLVPGVGLQYESGRLGVNVRILACLFFLLFIVSHFWFAAQGVKMPYYIVINGIVLLIYFAIFYKMQGIKEY